MLQLRNRVRTQQQEREKEQDDHAIMLRELQKLLASERLAKENLEHQVLCDFNIFLYSINVLNFILWKAMYKVALHLHYSLYAVSKIALAKVS